MIKVDSMTLEGFNENGRNVKASLIADTKDEVIAIGNDAATVAGLTDGDKLTLGSTCFCANADFGILNSEGVWTF